MFSNIKKFKNTILSSYNGFALVVKQLVIYVEKIIDIIVEYGERNPLL